MSQTHASLISHDSILRPSHYGSVLASKVLENREIGPTKDCVTEQCCRNQIEYVYKPYSSAFEQSFNTIRRQELYNSVPFLARVVTMRKQTRFNQQGSTLAEVTIAVALIAVMAGSIVATYNYGFFVMGLARENQRATQVILEKAETIRLFSWDQLDMIPDQFSDTYDPHAAAGKQGAVYHGTCVIGNVPFATSYSDKMRQVTISLVWTNQMKGIVRSRSMQTLIAKDGIQNYVY